jgi:hypothetical protein
VQMSRSLRRQGRFIVLRECVTTSGRKLRGYSAAEILGVLLGVAIRGVRQRKGLELWYGERRTDPGFPADPSQQPKKTDGMP